jgi:hypothetical protein
MELPHVLEVLTYTPVKWLNYSNSLQRIIELWEPLKCYYEKYGDADDEENMTKSNELYLRLLMILLSKLTHYNIKFQTKYLYYKDILKTLKESFIVFAQLILKNDKKNMPFEDIYKLSWQTDNIKDVQSALCSFEEFMNSMIQDYAGIRDLVAAVSQNVKKEVLVSCRKFILKVLSEMKKRFSIDEKIIRESKAVFLSDVEFNKEIGEY